MIEKSLFFNPISLRCRRNLTPVSNICESAPNALFCSEFDWLVANQGEEKSETHFR